MEIVLLEHAGKEFLREVLRVFRTMPLAAHVEVNGIPIGLAKAGLGGVGSRRGRLARLFHREPIGVVEGRRFVWIEIELRVRHKPRVKYRGFAALGKGNRQGFGTVPDPWTSRR